jgi:hypothetical protein
VGCASDGGADARVGDSSKYESAVGTKRQFERCKAMSGVGGSRLAG